VKTVSVFLKLGSGDGDRLSGKDADRPDSAGGDEMERNNRRRASIGLLAAVCCAFLFNRRQRYTSFP